MTAVPRRRAKTTAAEATPSTRRERPGRLRRAKASRAGWSPLSSRPLLSDGVAALRDLPPAIVAFYDKPETHEFVGDFSPTAGCYRLAGLWSEGRSTWLSPPGDSAWTWRGHSRRSQDVSRIDHQSRTVGGTSARTILAAAHGKAVITRS
jgi:hypothetical protein